MNAHVRHFTMVEEGALRQRIEALIESMLSLLDQLDGDPDLEPSLGGNLPYLDADPRLIDIEGDEVELLEGYDEDAEEDDPAEDEHDREYTSIERHGMGFCCPSPDDEEEEAGV